LTGLHLPPVFGWLMDRGGLDASEMLRTFNCGIGMVLVVDPEAVDSVTEALTNAGETVHPLGRIVGGESRFDGLFSH
ncbi:MAG: AIR synthase-related protein, partial [Pseudomonadota bacterium]